MRPASSRSSKLNRRIFYGWYIAGAGAGTNFIVLGITFFGFGVFLEEFRLTSGWSVTAIALGFSIQMLQQGLLAPVTGHILDRVGPRKMAVTGAARSWTSCLGRRSIDTSDVMEAILGSAHCRAPSNFGSWRSLN